MKPANILLEKHLKELGFNFEREYRFHETRRWKADYHLLGHRILIELHGSVYQQGRHTRGAGFEDDREKMNTAQMLGYRVLEFSTSQVLRGFARDFLKHYLT